MKIYKKYKNFIPDSFYFKVEEHKNKQQNILICIFLTFNLILLPTNFKNLSIINKKDVKFSEYESYSDKGNFKLQTIRSAVNELFEEDFEEVHINNNCGEILVDSLNEVNTISKSGLLDVSEVKFVESEKYKIGVNINEQ